MHSKALLEHIDYVLIHLLLGLQSAYYVNEAACSLQLVAFKFVIGGFDHRTTYYVPDRAS